MAIPTPRSYQTILNDMVNTFLSRYGLNGIKVGGPILSLFESAAQGIFRSTKDFFDLLDIQSLDRATGSVLDQYAADEGTSRRAATFSGGYVNVTDSSFTKVETSLYPGVAAPTVGGSFIKVTDASDFTPTGSLYIGRDTLNLEGPVGYASVADSGDYWQINLSTPLQKFHNLNETVILAQGGVRNIPAGTQVKTKSNNSAEPVRYSTLYSAQIEDGETSVENIQIACTQPGIIGNVPKNTIVDFDSKPFTGATVTNTQPLTNGLALEDDSSLRERIKNLRQSRVKGTPLSILTAVYGVAAKDESKVVVSASLVKNTDANTILYIDDGNGYEEKNTSVTYEPLVDQAVGGETWIQLMSGVPVSKAFLTSSLSAPFALNDSDTLAVKIGGVLSEHVFEVDEFRAIDNATAYEVVSSINGDSSIDFSARTSENGTKVIIFAKNDTNEDIELSTPSVNNDANLALGFEDKLHYTLHLYKNDELLFKDGKYAIVTSTTQSYWGVISSGATLTVDVDGTGAVTYTFINSDFSNAQTGYVSVASTNSLEAWATVFNAKIPGITASVTAGRLALTSNLGASSRASVVLSKDIAETDSLIDLLMFTATQGLDAYGKNRDYTLDKNTGQIKLTTPMVAGEILSAGTRFTQAYVQSDAHTSGVITTTDAKIWVAVDGAAEIIPHTVDGSMSITGIDLGDEQAQYTFDCGTETVFANVAVGDWVIFSDPSFDNIGAWRVSAVTALGVIEFDTDEISSFESGVYLSANGLTFVRTSQPLQTITFVDDTYTPTTAAQVINAQIHGANATVYQNNKIRLATNTYGESGDIMVAASTNDNVLKLPIGSLETGVVGHLASVDSAEGDIPAFFGNLGLVDTGGDGAFAVASAPSTYGVIANENLIFQRRLLVGVTAYGSNVNKSFTVGGVSGTDIDTFDSAGHFIPSEYFITTKPYSISAQDVLDVIVDKSDTTKNFSVPLYRNFKGNGSYSYANPLHILDQDSAAPQTPGVTFGSTDLSNMAVYMHPKTISHYNVANKGILWRYSRWGLDGQDSGVIYTYPTAPDQGYSVAIDTAYAEDVFPVKIQLKSGSAITIPDLNANTQFCCYINDTDIESGTNTEWRWSYVKYALPAHSLVRGMDDVVTATLDVTSYPGITDCGLAVGDSVYLTSGIDARFPTGTKILTYVDGLEIKWQEPVGPPNPGDNGSSYYLSSSGATDPDFSSVQTGDMIALSNSMTGDNNSGSFRIYDINNNADGIPEFSVVRASSGWDEGVEIDTPYSLDDTDNISFYPITVETASDIITWVNANSTLISGALMDAGSGDIDYSTWEESLLGIANHDATSLPCFTFVDGINYVASYNSGTDAMTLKLPVTSYLSDMTTTAWEDEEIRLVPVTAQNIVDWLNVATISGLSGTSDISMTNVDRKVQITSDTLGNEGAVQVIGGSANAAAMSVVGSASLISTNGLDYYKVNVPSNQVAGLTAGSWVKFQANYARNKTITLSTNPTNFSVAFDAGAQLYKVTSSRALQTAGNTTNNADSWLIVKQGDFTGYFNTTQADARTFQVSDWISIAGAANSSNNGWHRIIQLTNDGYGFWVYNPLGVSEVAILSSTDSYRYNSIMPNDVLVINSDILGEANRGRWTVVDVENSTNFWVSGTMGAIGATNIASEANNIHFEEAEPFTVHAEIKDIFPSSISGYMDVIFDVNTIATLTNKISSEAGYSMVVLGKLGFDTGLSVGLDAYSYTSGLIGEVNRVIYGDSSNPSVYPGVVAAGATIGVSSPLIKRIQISLGVRLKVNNQSVINRIKNTVASVINNTPLGQSIALSDIVSAANSIAGAGAVTVLAPIYGVGNDVIAVQSHEKPRIIDIDEDVLVNIVGT